MGIRFILGFFLLLSTSLQADTIFAGIHNPIVNYNKSVKDFILAMNVFTKAIANEAGLDYELSYYETTDKLVKDFEDGKINLVVTEPLTIIKYFKPSTLLEGFIGYKKDQDGAQTIVILRNKDDKRNIKDILQKGKIVYNMDPSIELYSKLLAKRNSIKKLDTVPTKNTQQSILKLFFKKADLALVDLSSYKVACELNPQIAQKLEILESVPNIPMRFIGYMRKGVSPTLHKQILDIIPTFNQTAKGKQMLYLFQAENLHVTKPSDLKALRKLYDEYTK